MDIKYIPTSIKGLNIYLNKVVSDERGSYCDMAPGGTDNPLYADGIKHIHASIATKKFIARGGHYHYRLKENFFTLSGTALWYFYDFNKNSPTFGNGFAVVLGYDKLGIDLGIPEFTIDKNSAAQISIDPGVYHMFWPLSDVETVVAGTGSLDYDVKDYNRTKIEDVPGALEVFEKVKEIILEHGDLAETGRTEEGEPSEDLKINERSNLKVMHKIKAIIPAAKNNQQRPFSHTINKHLIPLGGKPMIFYPIENLVSSGFKEIGVIISSNDELMRQVVGSGERWGIKIEYIVQKELMGLGSAIMSAREYIKDDPFVLYLGDNIIKHNIADLIERFFDENLNALLTLNKANFPQRFGVPEIKDGKIVKVEERPMHPKSEFAVAGVYIYDSNAFSAMDSIKLSDRGQYEIADIHNYYINNDLNLSYEIIDKWWKDRGKPEDLLEGNKFVLKNCIFENKGDDNKGEVVGNARIEGNVKIGKGTRVIGKTLVRGPVVIGSGCLIKDSYVGPYTSIGNKTELIGTEIEYSLVMDGSTIFTEKKIVNSVIGRNASVVSGESNLPRGNRLIIGENSVVGW
ncbi:MAG: glucose-1-phosphate thymidylyltransferase [Minisyncoccia bacterium]